MDKEVTVRGSTYRIRKEGAGPVLLLLHGFTGDVTTWDELVSPFKHHFTCLAVDLPGHGKTRVAKEHSFSMQETCRDLLDIIKSETAEPVHLLGYSMGGRVALQFALAYPEQVATLTLESASPGLKTEEEQTERRKTDEALAIRIEREGLPAFVDFWQDIPLFQSQKKLPSEKQLAIRHQRLSADPDGLAASLRGMGTGSQPSVWHRINEVRCPVLLATGEWDQKFVQIAEVMAKSMNHAVHESFMCSGHAIHVEQPEKFGTMLMEFLQNRA